jgi:hypothetical protein
MATSDAQIASIAVAEAVTAVIAVEGVPGFLFLMYNF